MFIAVDLPEPDGPITATKSPGATVEVDALQRLEGGRAAAIGLGDAPKLR